MIHYYRAALLAISAYLETFQKIADAATNARGMFSLNCNRRIILCIKVVCVKLTN